MFNLARVYEELEEPTGWRGSLDGRRTFLEKDLFSKDGYKITLHKMIAADDSECFHSHPATAIRWIVKGGYVEELYDGRKKNILEGSISIVRPNTKHRIHSLIEDESISLWIRSPKTHEIELMGSGWAAQLASETQGDKKCQ